MRILEEKETINDPCVDIASTESRSLIQVIVGVGGATTVHAFFDLNVYP